MRYITPKQLAEIKGNISEREIQNRCTEGRFIGAKKEKGKWIIPAHNALPSEPEIEATAIEKIQKTVGIKKLNEALIKRGHISQSWKMVIEFGTRGVGQVEAERSYSRKAGISFDSLQRWKGQHKAGGLEALVDSRGRKGKKAEAVISPEAWETFKGYYLTQKKLPVNLCLQMLIHYNHEHKKGWTIPTVLRSMQRYAKLNIPSAVLTYHREGQAAYDAKCAPYIQTDLTAIEPGSVWIGDHHEFNSFVWSRGKLVRPWITLWMDMRSRAFMGWYISDNPNSVTIMLAFKKGLEEWGPPAAVKIDNGRDYDSQLFTGVTKRRRILNRGYLDEALVTGIYGMLGTTVSFSLPYHPQSKAIERAFDTVDCHFTKPQTSYCGKTTQEKPAGLVEYLKSDRARKEIPTLDEFRKQADLWINSCYNNTGHSGRGMDGKSPLEVLATRTTKRSIDPSIIPLLLRMWTPELKVGKNGVMINKLWYGQYDEALLIRQGQMVRCSYDPDDMSRVWVYDAKTMRLITAARQAQLTPYGPVSDGAVRIAQRRKNHARKMVREFVNKSYVSQTDIALLAVEAQRENSNPKPEMTPAENIEMVQTPLDGTLADHVAIETNNRLRQAVGAERHLDFQIPKRKIDTRKLFDGDLFFGPKKND